MYRGRIVEAKKHYEVAASVMESDYHAQGMLMTCAYGLKDADGLRRAAQSTLHHVEQVLAHDPSNGAAISFGVSALASLGERERATEWMERALLIDPENLNMRYNFACALAKLGDREAALRMFESAVSRLKGSLGNIEADPELESLRDDPRFQKIVADAKKRLGIKVADAATAA
jgi:adenylate cyclase